MEKSVTNKNTAPTFNKYGYIVFVAAGIVFLFLKEWSNVIIFIGLALIFDPFNTKVPFPKRPVWQKLILFAHLAIVLTAILMEVF